MRCIVSERNRLYNSASLTGVAIRPSLSELLSTSLRKHGNSIFLSNGRQARRKRCPYPSGRDGGAFVLPTTVEYLNGSFLFFDSGCGHC